MKTISFKLNPDEEKEFEYHMYQFQGLQIAMNQYLYNRDLVYNDEHISRLLNEYTEKFMNLRKIIQRLLNSRGYDIDNSKQINSM